MALGSFEAGKVHIRVLPDASGFNRKLRPELMKAKRDAEKLMRIEVTPVLNKQALQRIKAQLSGLGGTAKIQVDADTSEAKRKLDEATEDRTSTVHVKADPADLQKSLDEGTRDRGVRVHMVGDSDDLERSLRRSTRDRGVKVKTEADSRDLEKSLNESTRNRSIKLPLEADFDHLEKRLKKATKERKPLRIRIQETVEKYDKLVDAGKDDNRPWSKRFGDEFERLRQKFKESERIPRSWGEAWQKSVSFLRKDKDIDEFLRKISYARTETKKLREFFRERRERRSGISASDGEDSSSHSVDTGKVRTGGLRDSISRSVTSIRSFIDQVRSTEGPLSSLRNALSKGAQSFSDFYSRVSERARETFERMKNWVTRSNVDDESFERSGKVLDDFNKKAKDSADKSLSLSERISQRMRRIAEATVDKIHWITTGQFEDDDAEDVTNRFFDAFEKGISNHDKPDFKLSDLVDFSDDDLLRRAEERMSDYRKRLQDFEKQNRTLIRKIANSASFDAARGTESFDQMNARLQELARQANLARKNLQAMDKAMREASRNGISKKDSAVEDGSSPLMGVRSLQQNNALLDEARRRFADLADQAERLGNIDMARGLRESMEAVGRQIEQNLKNQKLFGQALSETDRVRNRKVEPGERPSSPLDAFPQTQVDFGDFSESLAKLTSHIQELKEERAKLSSDLHKAVQSGDVEGVDRLQSAFANLRDRLREAREQMDSLNSAQKVLNSPVNIGKDLLDRLRGDNKGEPIEIEAEVDLDDTVAKEKLSRLTEDKEVTVDADADTGRARMKMASLTRPRHVLISPKLNKAAFVKVATALASLSGARAAFDFTKKFTDFIKDMDKNLGALVTMTSVISTLSSGVLSLTSHIFALGRSLVTMIPALYAVPGLVASFGVATWATVNALKKWDEKMKDVNDRFKDLNSRAANKFWDAFETPMRRLINNLFPAWERGFLNMSEAMGNFFVKAIEGAERYASQGGMNRIFDSMTKGVESMSRAMAPLTEGLLRFVEIGVSYFPRFGDWFTDMANKFNDWTKTADITSAIDKGVQAMKDLWRVAVETWNILDSISKAATAAGGATLGDFADALGRLHERLETVQSQWILTTLFKGANDAMFELGKSFEIIWDALSRTADKVAQVMVGISGIVNAFVDLMTRAFSDTSFTDEFVQAIKDVKTGMEGLAPHGYALGAVLGAISSVVGTMAKVFFPLFGTVLEELAPIFQDLARAAEAVIPVLGTWLKDAIKGIGDVIGPIIDKFADWVEKNPELAATLGIVAVAIGGIMAVVGPALGALASFIGTVTSIFGGVGAVVGAFSAGGALEAVGAAVASAAAPIAIAVAAVLALAFAFKYTWDRSEEFRQRIESIGQHIAEAAQPLVKFFNDELRPALEDAWGHIQNAFKKVGDGIQTFMEGVADLADALAPALQPVVWLFTEIFGPILKAIIDNAARLFEHLFQVVGSVFGAIGEIFKTIAALLRGDFSGALEHLKNAFKNVFDAIFNLVGAVIRGILLWISTAIGRIAGFAGKLPGMVWNFIKGIPGVLAKVPEMIFNIFKRLNLFNSGHNLIIGFGQGIVKAFNKVKEWTLDMLGWLRSLFPFSPAKRGPFSRSAPGGYLDTSGGKMMRDWGKGIVAQQGFLSDNISTMMDDIKSDIDFDLAPSISTQNMDLGFDARGDLTLSGSLTGSLETALISALSSGVELRMSKDTGRAILGYGESAMRASRSSW